MRKPRSGISTTPLRWGISSFRPRWRLSQSRQLRLQRRPAAVLLFRFLQVSFPFAGLSELDVGLLHPLQPLGGDGVVFALSLDHQALGVFEADLDHPLRAMLENRVRDGLGHP